MPVQPLFEIEDVPRPPQGDGLTAETAGRFLRDHQTRFLRLQFCDILGASKSVEVPASQLDRALAGELAIDGSAVEGFARIEEPDLLLRPDLNTLRLLPWGGTAGRVASVICDVYRPNGTPFEGDPRGALRRVIAELAEAGLEARVGMEAEFFLFQRTPEGTPGTRTQDSAGYFDAAPADRGDAVRRDVVNLLEALGLEVESAYHDIAPGQHSVDFRYSDALTTADNLVTLKSMVRIVAQRYGLHASFMPKPLFGHPGCGMHTHHSLLREGHNVFHDPEARDQLSDALRFFVGGLLRHARGFAAVTNPLVNSYKRLVPGYQAPTHVAWSSQSRTPLVRIPARRGDATRCEVRLPDPTANPYLALAVQLAAGLDGIRNETEPGEPINKNIWQMSPRERQRLKIEELPRNLGEALDALEKSPLVRSALGEHIYAHFTSAKRAEFEQYLAQVHTWELERYLEF